MARRLIVALCVLLACLSMYAAQVAAEEDTAERPDMIVVMVDDLGAIDERILKRLPEIRSLWLQGGLRFESAYSETPLCCPGRASFLTGQHTRRHGVVVNDARRLDPGYTIATVLNDAGYYTFMVGKYLNGADGLSDHTPPGWDRVAMLGRWDGNVSSEWWIDGFPQSAGHKDRFVADKARELLSYAPTDEPLFAWITPHAPHEAEATGDEWLPDIEPRYSGDPRCDGIDPWKPPSYEFPRQPNGFPLDDICRSLLTVDDMVGQLRDEAERQGRHPTWVFMSDNGMAWGAGGYAMKNVPQAGRLPLYFAGPGVKDGSTSALISNIDIAPTLADLAGVRMSRADGKSFQGVLGDGRGGRNAMLEDHPVGGETGKGPSGPWWGVRTRDWHLVEWNGTHLYDLNSDPWEMHDVVGGHLDIAVELADKWHRPLSILQPSPPPSTPRPSPTAPSSPGPTDDPPKSTPTPDLQPSASPAPSLAPSSAPANAPTEVPIRPTPPSPEGPLQSTTPPSSDTPSGSPVARPTDDSEQAVVPVDDKGPRDIGPGALVAFSAVAAVGAVLLLTRPRFRPSSSK